LDCAIWRVAEVYEGEFGGLSGPFWSISSTFGRVIAMQIPSKAKQIAGVKLILDYDKGARQVTFGTSEMLIYLDANIVQYIADYYDYVYQDIASEHEIPNPKANDIKLATELAALRRLVFIDQFFDWVVVAPAHLMGELLSGKPTQSQLETSKVLSQAWKDALNWGNTGIEPSEEKILSIEHWLTSLNLRDKPDRRNLAEAIALQSSWFLTCDKNIIKRVSQKRNELRNVTDDIVLLDSDLNTNQILKRLLTITKVARPSEFIATIEGRFLFP